MKKRIAALILMFSFLIPAKIYAYEFPDEFWELNQKYERAVSSKNNYDIITYGTQELYLMGNEPESYEKQNILITRYNEVGNAYANVGDYESSADYFELLYNYTLRMGDRYYDYNRTAKAKVKQYSPCLDLYTDGGTSKKYGVKNEHGNGVLFGLCSNGETRSKLSNESLVLTYQELGQSLLPYNTSVVSKAASAGKAVEFALNCPKEGIDIRNIKSKASYLEEISKLFSKYPDTPVFLRFAAEFDVWEIPADPKEFISAFRYVAKYFRDRNSNVAMVWSVNQVSSWNVDIDDYYPGDDFVDWIGISFYAQKYFLADKYQDDDKQVAFQTGRNSDPVLAIKDIVETYGKRRPVIITESGCGHKVVKYGEDATDFALERLKEYLYYIPMVYPQVKIMAYFDWYVENEPNDYRLSTNKQMQDEYIKATKGLRYIQDKYSGETAFCYRQIGNASRLESVFPVACYAHKYDTKLKHVSYYIDDDFVGFSSDIPFETYIDASEYTGVCTLKAVAKFEDGTSLESEFDVNISKPSPDISVEISGKNVYFDQDPVLYNDRTMVPMRKIFEALGADVTWDENEKTVTGKKGDRTVKITVGSKKMYINKTKTVTLDTAPIIMSDRTLVPIRAVAEGLGCDVDWDARRYRVIIEPKVFTWSEWDTNLPSYVNEDLYYIDKMTQRRYRTRELEYFTMDHYMWAGNYVRTDTYYGAWSDWSDRYVQASETVDVQTRTASSPVEYLYAHYCVGYDDDPNVRYHSGNYRFCDQVTYHQLGWFDHKLPYSEDSTSDYTYYVNGEKHRCSNSCFRWYIMDTRGGDYTEYRYRDIYKVYVYSRWTDWSEWSEWGEVDYIYYTDDDSIEKQERTLYSYKEK